MLTRVAPRTHGHDTRPRTSSGTSPRWLPIVVGWVASPSSSPTSAPALAISSGICTSHRFDGIQPFTTFPSTKPCSIIAPSEVDAAAWVARPIRNPVSTSAVTHSEVGVSGLQSLIVGSTCGLSVDSDRLRLSGGGAGGGYSK